MRLILLAGLLYGCGTLTAPSRHSHGTFLTGGWAEARPGEKPDSALQDVDVLCPLVARSYAYYATRQMAWEEACALARDEAAAPSAATPVGHLAILERLLDQLWDNHASLGANSAVSPRLVPSGSDYWIEPRNGLAVVTAVRPGSGAATAGLAVGDVVVELNGEPVLAAAMHRIRAARDTVSEARLTWAMNAQAAGYRGGQRAVTVQRDDSVFGLDLGDPEPAAASAPVTWDRLPGNLGYIRFEDSLGRQETVEAFDSALETLRGVDGWIIDLRNTPGGGNTSVAEPILARFIRGVKPYQEAGPRWSGESVRRVASRGPWRVRKPVAVLAGRWTGSMGEGMAIGFDGLRRARVFGSPMAGLAGGIAGFDLPSGLQVRFPTYDLRHVSGVSRHDWQPPDAITADNGDGPDLALDWASAWLALR